MIELRENEEKLLAKIQDMDNENSIKDNIEVTCKMCKEAELQQLIDFKLLILIGTMDLGSKWLVKLTEDGKHYFEDKEIALKKKLKKNKKEKIEKIIERVCWVITTAIAIIALFK